MTSGLGGRWMIRFSFLRWFFNSFVPLLWFQAALSLAAYYCHQNISEYQQPLVCFFTITFLHCNTEWQSQMLEETHRANANLWQQSSYGSQTHQAAAQQWPRKGCKTFSPSKPHCLRFSAAWKCMLRLLRQGKHMAEIKLTGGAVLK